MANEAEATSLLHSSLGYEKNPWCMAYVGVKARTTPRKPFAPFGLPVDLTARSFAQPFGGRIGPWYRNGWSRGAPISDGAAKTDRLSSARAVNNVIDGASGAERYPNYSRYPGDNLGLRSRAAIGSTRLLVSSYETTKLSLAYYSTFDDLQITGDPLAWDPSPAQPQDNVPPTVRNIRRAEMIAVAPDVFDATYYSIDPQYFGNYLGLNSATPRFPNLPSVLGKKLTPMPDLGGRNTVPLLKAVNVDFQIQAANGLDGNAGLDPSLLSNVLMYPIRKTEHLLTGWASVNAKNFNFPEAKFGKCDVKSDPKMMTPGGCAIGGRTGYSVRIISREHLLLPTWQVGGEGSSPGEILNKPGPDFYLKFLGNFHCFQTFVLK
ncbi:MAG: hypothetical protein EOP05_15805 [Proteobacteria bacterium]|nr:MAG: hypothetical protein EOP05_15805 [Pseudomonadota bacterium]